ncbi:MAG: DJ-1/PfpI family protein [Clostridia bacterium]|nr:DJ-1/PfpI family protein [Clostridia bacterium]
MIYVFLAEGFEEVEALATVDVLRRAGLDVKTVGVGAEVVSGSHSIPVVCDTVIDAVQPDGSVDAIVLPGGMPGTLNLEKNEKVNSFIDYAYSNGKYVCAICAAPSILGKKGLLEGKEAVCFPGFEEYLYGAKLSDKSVCADGKIITAKACGVALKFGKAIAEQFIGSEKADALWESLYND